jgi:hypothetical protein
VKTVEGYKLEQNGLYGDSIEISITSERYSVSVNLHFVSEVQVTQTPTVIVGHVVTEGNITRLLVSGKLSNDFYYRVLHPVARNIKL